MVWNSLRLTSEPTSRTGKHYTSVIILSFTSKIVRTLIARDATLERFSGDDKSPKNTKKSCKCGEHCKCGERCKRCNGSCKCGTKRVYIRPPMFNYFTDTMHWPSWIDDNENARTSSRCCRGWKLVAFRTNPCDQRNRRAIVESTIRSYFVPTDCWLINYSMIQLF